MLNIDQLEAFKILKSYIKDRSDSSIYVLKGWAGTGKTYCISYLIKHLIEVVYPTLDWYKIAVTGPTNKAVRVIKSSAGIRSDRVIFQTIHKLLGLKEKITDDGSITFENDGKFFNDIRGVKVLIIDEVSMLDDTLFEKVIGYRDKLKIICMGDPAQIPPVGRPNCIPFKEDLAETYDIKTIQLHEIMRQKDGNGIIDASVSIRQNIIFNAGPTPVVCDEVAPKGCDAKPMTALNEKGEGIEYLNINNPDVRNSFGDLLAKYFKSSNDIDYVKVIAWRNKTVGTMNQMIRNLIYGEEAAKSKILIGDKLIVNAPIFKDKTIIINTNDEINVDGYQIKFKEGLKYYEVSTYEGKVKIEILHEDSESDFNKQGERLKNQAVDTKGKDKAWIKYYNFLRMFADVSYAYAITCHKSQGSTYNTTFVMESDIDANSDVIERNRIKYTAYTRASRKVYVLKRW